MKDFPNSMAVLLTAVVLILILVNLLNDIRRIVRAYTVVHFGFFAWYLLEAVVMPEETRQYGREVYDFAMICLATAVLCFNAGYHFPRRLKILKIVAERLELMEHERFIWPVLIVSALIGFTPMLYYADGNVVLIIEGVFSGRRGWGGVLGRGRYGDLRSVLLSLEVLITAASPLAFLLLLRGKLFFPQHVLATVVCLWPPIRAVGSGYRSAMIQTTGALAAVIFWRAKPPVQRTLVVLFLVSILPMYYLMGSIGDSRSGGFSEFQFRTDATWYGYEMFRELEFITTKFPDTEPYWMGYSYYIQLINPIPRFLWPDKPKAESGLIMAKLYNEIDPNTGEPFMTISPGIIGEMYMNFGFPGVVALSLIGGWIIRGWDHLVETYSHSTMVMIFYSVGLVTIFVAGRAVNMPQLYSIILVAAMAFISVPSVAKERRRQAMIAATAPTT